VLLFTGRLEEAAPHLRRAAALDPEMASIRYYLGVLYLVKGDYEAAIGELRRVLAFPGAPGNLAYAHPLNGYDERASEVLIEAAPSEEAAAALRRAFDEGGFAGMMRLVLDYQISQSGRPCTNHPDWASVMLAFIGEADRMYECIDEALAAGQVRGLYLKVHPNFDPYRDDPRFTARLRRMGLEE
jgi:tetratricopeptide (TPR) repeat protein